MATNLKLPLEPDNLVIVTINFMQSQLINMLNDERSSVKRFSAELYKSYDDNHAESPRMTLETQLTSYEVVDRYSKGDPHQGKAGPQELEMLRSSISKIKVLEEIISKFNKIKLAFFDDVDFDGGEAYIKEFNKLIKDTEIRISGRKIRKSK